ncbi:hypothetical protein FSARC_11855 [Fusarium sarcochroum]|uniref:FAD/NAD(P)-binding domain-containing protein n=1 Tax=Fusarium sarcochroum TaxID=1208366 RepID=A0A8H4TCK4_9HYPO|nr:hypothetical protein FSARC_11855 [Fusarium sarcochroum]
MALPSFRLIHVYLRFLIPRVWEVLCDKVRAWVHRLTYRAIEPCQNVVVIGGSFGGIELTRKLAQSLPTGYRVVLLEKNSHFNYPFNFPRYSVLQGHEHLSFIPYDGVVKGTPKGIYSFVRGEAATITDQAVHLKSGKTIPYTYVVIATGATQRPPARVIASDKTEAQAELRSTQGAIKAASKVAVIGAGAVGVELAADIKGYYPDKLVTLIHSRGTLLPRFPGVHRHVLAALQALGVDVLLGERPQLPSTKDNFEDELEQDKRQTISFSDGRSIDYDLIIPCTGQSPNSGLLQDIEPDAISNSTGRILTQPTLQVSSKSGHATRLFAFGDVAETGGALMARSAWYQAQIVRQNILDLIKGKKPTATYLPNLEVEGALKLTLGKSDWIMYVKPKNGDAVISSYSNGNEDLDVYSAWNYYGADVSSVDNETRDD